MFALFCMVNSVTLELVSLKEKHKLLSIITGNISFNLLIKPEPLYER